MSNGKNTAVVDVFSRKRDNRTWSTYQTASFNAMTTKPPTKAPY